MGNLEFEAALFVKVSERIQAPEPIQYPQAGYWRRVGSRFAHNPPAVTALVFLGVLALFAMIFPKLSVFAVDVGQLTLVNKPPSPLHWFGTDGIGRDLFVRVFYGMGRSLGICAAGLLGVVPGVLLGCAGALAPGRLGAFLARVARALRGVPLVFFALILLAFLDQSGVEAWEMALAFAVTCWPAVALTTQEEIRRLARREFVLAAKAAGASGGYIALHYGLPFCAGPVAAATLLLLPRMLFAEVFLSLLGLGLSPPDVSFGVLCGDGLKALRAFPYQLLFPALFLCALMATFTLLGDGARQALKEEGP